jgi:hypothetical protein
MEELGNNARFIKFASMYTYFKVHKMKVIWNTTGLVTNVVSAFDPDSDLTPNDMQQITSHLNCRFHKLSDSTTNSRTVNLQTLSKWQDFYNTQGAGAQLGTNKLKSTITYGFSGLAHAKSVGLMAGTMQEEWVVEFRGLRDRISTTVNHADVMDDNVGPASPIPSGMDP